MNADNIPSAIAISAVIQFFAVQYKGYEIVWPGNTISYDNCDDKSCRYFTLGPDETHFGPGVGEFE